MESVKIGARYWPVELPSSYALRLDVLVLSGANSNRAACAALGLCCPTLAKAIGVHLDAFRGDLARYGAAVLDGVMAAVEAENSKRSAQGKEPIVVGVLDVLRAGAPLAAQLCGGILTESEVAAEEVFSAVPPEELTS